MYFQNDLLIQTMRRESPMVLIQDVRQDNHNAHSCLDNINLLIRRPDFRALLAALPIAVKSLTNHSLCFDFFLICRISDCLAVFHGAWFC